MFVCAECGASQPGPGRCASDGTELSAIGEDILLGTTIGAYRVARLLGIGGMGRVYKGVHPTIGSRVAIKVLSRECSDRRDLVDRFFAEAKAVNLIRHESIVNVLDLAMLPDGRPYIIMEYLDGMPLSAIVEASVERRIPVPLGGLARLTAEVLDALGAAHGKHIVHRDLKPDNIFVTPSGRPKVLDFGIAKLTELGALAGSATRTGSLLGTPHYMSPEQAAGRPVDHRADIYAIGVILFEVATGRKPFTAEALFDLLRQHVEAPPPSPRALRPDMPPELEHVILTALAKAPDQRFASAHAMSMALQHATQQLPPEQWAPITSVGAPAQPGGWAPTPPVSWSGGSSAPRPAPISGQASTVSAGHVTSSPREVATRSSGKGVWIALGAFLLVGAGVTAAVLASGSSGTSASGAPGSEASAGSEVVTRSPAKIEPAKVEPAKIDPAKVEPAKVERAKVERAKVDPAKVEPSNADVVHDRAVPTRTAQLAENPAQPVTALPLARGAWVVRHDLPRPPGYDPKHLEVAKLITYAIAEATKAVPDAQLYRIDSSGVSADGFADVTLATLASDHGEVELRFISPSHSKRDPSIPAGVPAKRECEFRIEATPDGIELSPMFASDCKETPLPPPRCSHAAVWKKALAKGAPKGNAVGSLGYRSDFHGRATWYFDVGFGTEVSFSELFHDDC